MAASTPSTWIRLHSKPSPARKGITVSLVGKFSKISPGEPNGTSPSGADTPAAPASSGLRRHREELAVFAGQHAQEEPAETGFGFQTFLRRGSIDGSHGGQL